MKKKILLLLPIFALTLSGCSFIDSIKKIFSSSNNATSEDDEDDVDEERFPYFRFNQFKYKLNSGVKRSELEGAPWINSNIAGMVNKIQKPSLKDDFYTAVNYEDLVNRNGGVFNVADTAVLNAMSTICDETSGVGNSSYFSKVKNALYDGNISEISAYFSSFDYESFVSSESLFLYSNSFFSIKKDESNKYYVTFNDGYYSGSPSIATLSIFDESIKNTKKTLINKVYDAFDLYLSNYYMNQINSFDESTEMASIEGYAYGLGESWSRFSFGNTSTSILDGALSSLGFTNSDPIYVNKPTLNVINIMNDTNSEVLKNALVCRILFELRFLSGVSNYKEISKNIGDARVFTGEGDISSIDDNSAALTMLKLGFPEAVERAYLEVAGDNNNKQTISNLIDQIISGYKSTASIYTWLDSTTRQALKEKLNYMKHYSCYSDKVKNYPLINEYDIASKSLFDLYNTYSDWVHDLNMNNLIETNQDLRYMPSYTVNAFYNPGSNSFVILNGLLGGININAGVEEMLGTMGVVIGHEISHSIDATGSRYDKDGYYNDWWSTSCRNEFNKKVNNLIEFYSQFNSFGSTYVDGDNVDGEVIADMGGVHICLEIAKTINNFNYDIFFKTYAKLWLISPYSYDRLKERAKDEHPFEYLRVNATLAQFDKFFETYDIKPGDRMYMPEDQKVAIW